MSITTHLRRKKYASLSRVASFSRGDGWGGSIGIRHPEAERREKPRKAEPKRTKHPEPLYCEPLAKPLTKRNVNTPQLPIGGSGLVRSPLIARILLTVICNQYTLPPQRAGGRRSRWQSQGGAGEYKMSEGGMTYARGCHAPALPLHLLLGHKVTRPSNLIRCR